MAAALEFLGVTKRYVAGTHGCYAHVDALRGVDLSVLEGESVAVVGAAGTGKSTLLFLAAGLLAPDAGVVRWFGDDRRTVPGRASYLFPGSRSTPRADGNAKDTPHIQLIDTPESLSAATLSRLAQWIEGRRRCGDAVVVATRDAKLGADLTDRVVTLRGGRAFPSIPTARVARVAERAVAARAVGGSER